MTLIGLAGQSCAGKNEAALILEKLNWHVIDADEVSRHLFSQNEQTIFNLFKDDISSFNIKLYDKDGIFNKQVFSSFVFSNPPLLKRLEDFLLPKIENRIAEEINAIAEKDINAKIAINAPTLHKTSLFFKCSYIMYIKANLFIRFFRALKRDNGSALNIIKRFFAQRYFDSQYLTKKSDILAVSNNSTLSKMEKSIELALRDVGLF